MFVDSIINKDFFIRGQQNDAYEFLVYLCGWLQDELVYMQTQTQLTPIITSGLNECVEFLRNEWKIKLLSTIVCSKNGCTSRMEENVILNLSFQNNTNGQFLTPFKNAYKTILTQYF